MKYWLYWLLFLGACSLGILLFQQHWLNFITDKHSVSAFLNNQEPIGFVVVIAVGALFTALGGSRQIVAFVLGYALNWMYGALLSTIITLMGATLCFYATRLLFREYLRIRFAKRLAYLDNLLKNNVLIKICTLRLLPVGSNLLTNLIMGCSTVHFLPFLVGSGVGYLPQMLIFALAGAGFGATNYYLFFMSITLFLIVFGASYYLKRLQSERIPLASDSNAPQ